MDTKLWEHMLIVIQAIFPGLIILWLADSNKHAMDKLYYYVHRMDLYVEKSQTLLDSISDIGNDHQDKLPYQKNFSYYLSKVTVSNDSDILSDDDDDELDLDDSNLDTDDELEEKCLGDTFMDCWKKDVKNSLMITLLQDGY